ncbi:MAG: NAD-dependent epimerase/dehydratase family protein [Anaerolineae bacterium]|nr:NAD-dependent epimerase/dehydratase family protein [Anaerolineae bacterium]
MTVVVTGAAGHLGGNLVRALLADGRRVRALVHRDRRALDGLDVEMVVGDVTDRASLIAAFSGAEVVYHAAGLVSIQPGQWAALHAVNVVGTRNVVQAAVACGVRRLIHFSSIHALDLDPARPWIDESTPLVSEGGGTAYSRSKAQGEREVRQGAAEGLETVILNPTAMLGPHDYRPSHQGEVLLALAQGKLPALVEGGFDWVDVRDVVAGAVHAETRAAPGAQYIVSGHWLSVRELADRVAAITGARVPAFTCPLSLAYLAAPLYTLVAQWLGVRPLFTEAALEALSANRTIRRSRAARDLGYQPRPLERTLVDTYKWFAQVGWLGQALQPVPVEVR